VDLLGAALTNVGIIGITAGTFEFLDTVKKERNLSSSPSGPERKNVLLEGASLYPYTNSFNHSDNLLRGATTLTRLIDSSFSTSIGRFFQRT
jgi:hypothetical protein